MLAVEVPQSVCTRHGLFLGAAGSPIIRLAMILFYPITKPFLSCKKCRWLVWFTRLLLCQGPLGLICILRCPSPPWVFKKPFVFFHVFSYSFSIQFFKTGVHPNHFENTAVRVNQWISCSGTRYAMVLDRLFPQRETWGGTWGHGWRFCRCLDLARVGSPRPFPRPSPHRRRTCWIVPGCKLWWNTRSLQLLEC